MRPLWQFLVSALPLAGSADALRRRQTTPSSSSNETAVVIPKRYIVEVASGATNSLLSGSFRSDDAIKVVKTFESDVFSGISIESDTHNVDSLLELPEVINAWPITRIQLFPSQPIQSFSDDAAAINYTIHAATGVDKLHAAGILGEGVKVGIVDSGIWYSHPALGGGFGEGFKISGGTDLVGNGIWPAAGEKEPDDDPIDQIGHGTHVAGIIVGETEDWKGVAPKATATIYKVFTQVDGTDDDTLIDAFLAAYNDDVDIITASIGGPSGWSTNAWAEVASRLVSKGVVVTIAAGNSGSAGPFIASSGSSGKEVISVASVDAEVFPATPFKLTFNLDGASNTTVAGYIASDAVFPTTVAGLPIIPLNFNTSDPADACEPYPAGSYNLTNAIALVRRGTCTFTTKQTNLEALGAKYILFYNNVNTIVQPLVESFNSLTGIITAEAGAAIIETVKAGGSVTGDFANAGTVVGLENILGGGPSTFTQWGGLYDLAIKPDIAAPGGSIFSTYLDDSYAILSGTSMATPYVAGIAALWISKHGGKKQLGPEFAKKLSQKIISSGGSLPWVDATGRNSAWDAPVPQVGNGLVDAYKVLTYDTELAYEKFELNDTLHFKDNQGVFITNTGSKALTYTFNIQPAAGFEALRQWDPTNPYWTARLRTFNELSPISAVPGVKFPSGTFTVKPGETKKAKFTFSLPQGLNATTLPVYSGKINIFASNGEELSVPYFGLASDLKKEINPIFDSGYPFSYSSVTSQSITTKPYYTFNLSRATQDFPKVFAKNKWGVKELRWDIYEAGWTEDKWSYPPKVGENGYVGTATTWAGSEGGASYFDPAYNDANDTLSFPLTITRTTEVAGTPAFHGYWWFGKLGNGTQIAPGNYTFRFAALLPFANPKNSESWNVWKTPQITVRPLN